jgi:hypothetical protein
MARACDSLYAALADRVNDYAIEVSSQPLQLEKAGQFDGLSITLNPKSSLEDRCYYLAHAVGSIVQWSVAYDQSKETDEELRDAKRSKDSDPERFERALKRYLVFETTSSEYAVWLLADTGQEWAIPSYTLFFRADLAAMEQFHRVGVAPVWQEFFPRWKQRVAKREQKLEPFTRRPIPPFQPRRIETREMMRENDGKP